MSEITWIKMFVDVFDDRKLSTLMRQEDGQVKVLAWFVLLAYAGKTNNDGKIMYSETQIFTIDHLKLILEYEKPNAHLTLTSAINYFVVNDMLLIDKRNKGLMIIKNWGKRQNAEALEKARENARIRQQRYYLKNKDKPNANLTQSMTSVKTLGNVIPNAILEVEEEVDVEVELEKEEEVEKNITHFVRDKEKSSDDEGVKETEPIIHPYDYRNQPRFKDLLSIHGGLPYGWFLGLEREVMNLEEQQFEKFKHWIETYKGSMSYLAVKEYFAYIKAKQQPHKERG